jgi:LAO/AO transport system kinase
MQGHALDTGVFIRSMATRGHLGGLSGTTAEAAQVLDASGIDYVIIETVGVGQDEVDIVRTADVCVVALVPGTGDEVQALKAGIMEIADVFVVNKSDRDGAEKTARDLQSMLGLDENMKASGWMPPIVKTVASLGRGVEELVAALERHQAWLDESGARKARRLGQLRLRVESLLKDRVLRAADQSAGLGRALEQAFAQREDPHTVAERLFGAVVRASG